MQKKILFSSPLCPDCGPFKERLENSGIRFLHQDITGSLASLKKFLAVRESAPEFKPVIDSGSIGIPCLVIGDNEKIIFDRDELEAFIKSEKE